MRSSHLTILCLAVLLLPVTSCGDSTGPAVPARLVFSVQPSAATAGAAFAPSPQVTVQDASGNIVSSSTLGITIALASGTVGANLRGTRTVSAVNGVAVFNGMSVDSVGSGYTLTATATGAPAASSAAFALSVAPAQVLAFTSQPTNVASASAISPAINVAVRDSLGNSVTTATNSVTLAITSGTGTSGAVLGGTTTAAAVNGVAAFANLTVHKAGTGYTLTAAGSGLTSATSSAFAVTPGTATKLSFIAQPSAVVAGAAVAPAVQVTVQDAQGNTVTGSTVSVTVAITSGTGKTGATLRGTTTLAAVAGIATFAGLSIDSAGTGYILTARSSGLTSVVSAAFAVTVGAASRLAFAVQPSAVNATWVMSPAVQVTVHDVVGNPVTTATNSVTLAITSGTGTSVAVLGGTLTVAAVGGVATFSDLTVDKVDTSYTLTATATGLTSATSSAFAVWVRPVQLVFTVQPSAVEARAVLSPAVQVTVQDTGGNAVTTAISRVTLAITSGTGTSGAVLGRTPPTVAAVNGVATFSNLMIDLQGTGYSLTATASGLTSATSSTFTVSSPPGFIVFQTWTGPPASANQFWRVQPDGSGLVQLTFYTGGGGASNYEPDLSPDRTRIVFGRNYDIWVMNADGTGQASQLTTDGSTSADTWPRWSADGTRIVWQRDNQVWTMAADGSGQVQLTSAGTNLHPSFSPDGTWMVFESTRDGAGVNELYRMSADGTNQTRLTFNNAVGVWSSEFGGPFVSPDGTKILFASGRAGTLELYVMGVDGSGETRLTYCKPRYCRFPYWSPDGRAIAYTWGNANGAGFEDIWTMSADGWSPRVVVAMSQKDYLPTWR